MEINKVNLYPNGFIIKCIDSEFSYEYMYPNLAFNYYGIEGDNWPIDGYTPIIDKKELNYLEDYLYKNIENTTEDASFVSVCNDIDFIRRYLIDCQKANIKIQLLFCESERPYPKYELSSLDKKNLRFVGYDYAYAEPDYYSSIAQDIPRVDEMKSSKLNRFGLFDSEMEVLEFISLRNELIQSKPMGMFESGNFIVYRLWEYRLDHETDLPLFSGFF